MVSPLIRKYMAEIGRRGGTKSHRRLSPETARNMVRIREARRAFKLFYDQCFWSFDPAYRITGKDVNWVAKELMQNGGRDAWQAGARLCH